MFKEAGLIEKYGSGIKRIRNAFINATGKHPVFEEIGEGFMVTVFSGTFRKKNVVENVVEKQNDKAAALLKLISRNGKISAIEIARNMGISERTAQRYIKGLQERQAIRRVGSDKGGYWEVIKGMR